MAFPDLWEPLFSAAEAGRAGYGRIEGGWEFVWASYGITWAAIALYALSLFVRRPSGIDKELPR